MISFSFLLRRQRMIWNVTIILILYLYRDIDLFVSHMKYSQLAFFFFFNNKSDRKDLIQH
jgi:hypothetical protein